MKNRLVVRMARWVMPRLVSSRMAPTSGSTTLGVMTYSSTRRHSARRLAISRLPRGRSYTTVMHWRPVGGQLIAPHSTNCIWPLPCMPLMARMTLTRTGKSGRQIRAKSWRLGSRLSSATNASAVGVDMSGKGLLERMV